MYKEAVVAELLYIGIVAEKGRCYRRIWKCGYKTTLKRHINALNKLQKCLVITNEKEIQTAVDKFIEVCKEDNEIGKLYVFEKYKVQNLQVRKHYENINKMIDDMFQQLLLELDKLLIDKRKIYNILCTLHNLPRVYLGNDEETLCNLGQKSITEEDALMFAIDNMDEQMKEKYSYYL